MKLGAEPDSTSPFKDLFGTSVHSVPFRLTKTADREPDVTSELTPADKYKIHAVERKEKEEKNQEKEGRKSRGRCQKGMAS
ncbi:hypothetical protein AVEN_234033-1 [Araneus ventricosus]|uniref:Uncharacterized protein n=1 Tax=Araneus ventricosus TaxID=182803 RepID=A0A4Y2FIQ5_ARAVE|nr:hypothetical protein AVEN_234033-1 [Araneus ventricosus]